jgi:hypothetical protein
MDDMQLTTTFSAPMVDDLMPQWRNMTEDEFLVAIREWLDKWEFTVNTPTDSFREMTAILARAGATDDILQDRVELTGFIEYSVKHSNAFRDIMLERDMKDTNADLYTRVYTAGICLVHVKWLILGMYHLWVARQPQFDYGMVDDSRIMAVTGDEDPENIDGAPLTPHQTCLEYALDLISKNHYRRHGDYIYTPVLSPVTYEYMHAWSEKMSIKSFVYGLTSGTYNRDLYRAMTRGPGIADGVVQALTTLCYDKFPDLVISRYHYAFKNGVYCTAKHEFREHGATDGMGSVVACKYFDRTFELADDWREIETRSLDIIFKTQYGDRPDYHEIYRTACVMLGRLLYDVGAKDDWQVLPFFKGLGGTGKSTILEEIVKGLFTPGSTKTIGNNCQKTFALDGVDKGKVWLGVDVDRNFALDQMNFQNMVTGESVSVIGKNKDARTVRWTVPGIMCGNEMPGYTDKGGGLGRRIVIFHFGKLVTPEQRACGLKDIIRQELPSILQKCNMAYLEAAREWKDRGFWGNCLQYFIDNQAMLSQNTNPLLEFLLSDSIVAGDDFAVPVKDFRTALNAYCRTANLDIKGVRWTPDFYEAPFITASDKLPITCPLRVERNPVVNGTTYVGEMIIGLKLVD